MGAWRELWATWGGGQRWIPGQKSRGLRPAPGVPLVYCQSVDQLPPPSGSQSQSPQNRDGNLMMSQAPHPSPALLCCDDGSDILDSPGQPGISP